MSESTRSRWWTRRVAAGALAVLTAGSTALLAAPAAQGIANGQPVAPGEMSFVTEVRNTQNGGWCTGTLIDPNWVLTAVHCAVPRAVSDVTVRVGSTSLGAGGEFRTITAIQRNPGYMDPIHGHNDVALLRLSAPVTTVTPVRLATPDQATRWDGPNDPGLAVGFGYTTTGPPTALQKISTTIRPPQLDNDGIPMLQISSGLCGGDSGGPLLVRDAAGALVQAGVVKSGNCNDYGSYSEVGAGPNRDWVLNQISKFSPAGIADWDRDGKQDIITRDNRTGDLLMFPGRGVRGYGDWPPARIGVGWERFTPFGVGDWDRDGHQDLIGRYDATGDLFMWPGRSTRGYPDLPVKIGNGWGIFTPVEIADWDRDSHQDIIARHDITGDVMLYPGQSVRGYSGAAPVRISAGWRNNTPFGMGDWDNDGKQDMITRWNGNGDVVLFPGRGVRGYPDPQVRVGNGWAPYTLFGIGDWDRDGKQDHIARDDRTGDMLMWPGRGVRGYGEYPPVRIGNGW